MDIANVSFRQPILTSNPEVVSKAPTSIHTAQRRQRSISFGEESARVEWDFKNRRGSSCFIYNK
jgi:hypothetical protein